MRTLKNKMIKESKSLECKDIKLCELEAALEAEATAKSELKSKLFEHEESMLKLQQALYEAETQVRLANNDVIKHKIVNHCLH